MHRTASTSSILSHTSSFNIMHAHDEELFHELQERGPLTVRRLQQALADGGMHPKDPRLRQVHARLAACQSEVLDLDTFKSVIESASLLVYRALTRKLVIADWMAFRAEMEEMYVQTQTNQRGKVATYIPALANADPNTWALSFCSIDGQQFGLGDTSLGFSVQSTSKPLNYLMALEEHGEAVVHRFVGREPSGRNFNELLLNPAGIPHNPLINAGSIMVTSLIQADKPPSDRFHAILQCWKRLTGYSRDISFSNTIYLSEKSTANRNYCLAYLMQESGAFQHGADRDPTHPPPRPWHSETDLEENLDLYFQCCSVEATTQSMSVAAATLANGGVCPLTGERVFAAQHVKSCLSLMLSCGMYDYSGEWAYKIGLPAKSGVSGCIMLVIPNVGGLALLSPRLDKLGNSARGIDFSTRMTKRFRLHFLNIRPGPEDADEDDEEEQDEEDGVDACEQIETVAAAAAVVGVDEEEEDEATGSDTETEEDMDADGPSAPLPPPPPPRRRPRSRNRGASLAVRPSQPSSLISRPSPNFFPPNRGPRCSLLSLLPTFAPHLHGRSIQDRAISFNFACASGDLSLVRAIMAQGIDLEAGDYDARTPIHLAATNGHRHIVEMLVKKGVEVNPVDRMGGTPLADAIREGHTDIVDFLRAHGGQLAEEQEEPDEAEGEEEEEEEEVDVDGDECRDDNDNGSDDASERQLEASDVRSVDTDTLDEEVDGTPSIAPGPEKADPHRHTDPTSNTITSSPQAATSAQGRSDTSDEVIAAGSNAGPSNQPEPNSPVHSATSAQRVDDTVIQHGTVNKS